MRRHPELLCPPDTSRKISLVSYPRRDLIPDAITGLLAACKADEVKVISTSSKSKPRYRDENNYSLLAISIKLLSGSRRSFELGLVRW